MKSNRLDLVNFYGWSRHGSYHQAYFASMVTPILVVIFFFVWIEYSDSSLPFFFQYISKDKFKVNLPPELIRYQIMPDTRNILRETTNEAMYRGFFQILFPLLAIARIVTGKKGFTL